jgi:hypothetical protein
MMGEWVWGDEQEGLKGDEDVILLNEREEKINYIKSTS